MTARPPAIKLRIRTVTLTCLVAISVGCGASRRPSLDGQYTARLPDGRSLTISLQQRGEQLYGAGRSGEEPFVMTGTVSSCAVATLMGPDGQQVPVAISRAAAEAPIVLRQAHTAPDMMVLEAADGTPAESSGPFSGAFEARRDGAVLAGITLEQRGELVTGTATILGQPAGIVGRVIGGSHMRGEAIFADESGLRLEAELSRDGDTMSLRGTGEPLALERQ